MTNVNLNYYPFIYIKFGKYYNNNEDYELLTNKLNIVYENAEQKNEKFCLLLDTCEVIEANPALTFELVKWLLSKKEKSAKYLYFTTILI